ncbi:hypothetical protein PG990_009288 [Apiospora arundinis]
MPKTPDPPLTDRSFSWETADMSNTDENTPYLDRKAGFLGPSHPLREPLEEILALPGHSGERFCLPDLFQPLSNNQSIINHRSERVQHIGQNLVWLDDSSYDKNIHRSYSGVMTSNAHIRRIHVPHPTRDTVSSIMCTAPWNQTLVLSGFIKRHIKADGQMSAHFLPGENDQAFIMELHLPFLVWRDRGAGSNREDTRRTKDGNPLREMQDMTFLTRTVKSKFGKRKNMPRGYLYEAQSSCVVTGYNNSYWTAISFSDTYFYQGADTNDPEVCGDNEDMLPYYDDTDMAEVTDPLTIGNFAVQPRMLDARGYFLVISKTRLEKVRIEWDLILYNVSLCVKNYLRNPHITSPSAKLTLASTDGHARAVSKSCKWVTGVMSLLQKLRITLEKVIKASKNFEQFQLVRIMGSEPTKILLRSAEEFRLCVNELEIIHDNLAEIRYETQVFHDQVVYSIPVRCKDLRNRLAASNIRDKFQPNNLLRGTHVGCQSIPSQRLWGNINLRTIPASNGSDCRLDPNSQGYMEQIQVVTTLGLIGHGAANTLKDLSLGEILRPWPEPRVFRFQEETTHERRLPVREPGWVSDSSDTSGPSHAPDAFRVRPHTTPKRRHTTMPPRPTMSYRVEGRSHTWSHRGGSNSRQRRNEHRNGYGRRTPPLEDALELVYPAPTHSRSSRSLSPRHV